MQKFYVEEKEIEGEISENGPVDFFKQLLKNIIMNIKIKVQIYIFHFLLFLLFNFGLQLSTYFLLFDMLSYFCFSFLVVLLMKLFYILTENIVDLL